MPQANKEAAAKLERLSLERKPGFPVLTFVGGGHNILLENEYTLEITIGIG